MHPILFEIGKIKIFSYGAMVATGFIFSLVLAGREAKRIGMSEDKIFDLGLYAMLFGLIGARMLHVLLNLDYYSANPLEIIMINRGGLAIQGGLLGGIIGSWVYIKHSGLPLWKTADMIIPYVALGQAIGRIGCFLNGCCYGKPTSLPWGVRLPGHLQFLHPVQLYLSLYLLGLFFILKKIGRDKRYQAMTFIFYILLFALGRFFIDFLREDLNIVFFYLTYSQLISLGFIFISLIFLLVRKRADVSPHADM